QIFHEGRIPGVVVTRELLEICERQGRSPDQGKAFFQELAAKQIAIYRGLGYRGAYLGGVHDFPTCENIMRIERSFAPDDWRHFAREVLFSRPGEFYFYGRDAATRLADPRARGEVPARPSRHTGPSYLLSKRMHGLMFTPGRTL